jgi:hypothetical protein
LPEDGFFQHIAVHFAFKVGKFYVRGLAMLTGKSFTKNKTTKSQKGEKK